MKYLISIICFCCGLLFLQCCTDNDPVKPPPVPTNPCASKHPVTADFEIYESPLRFMAGISTQWTFYDTDTLMIGDIIFKAKESNADYYEWQIGRETIKGVSQVQRNEFPLGEFSVQLIVHKRPDTTCFPTDDGKDTIVRRFRRFGSAFQLREKEPAINDDLIKPLWIGRYRGANTDKPQEEFTMELNTNGYYLRGYKDTIGTPDTIYTDFRVMNLIPGCTTRFHDDVIFGYKEVMWSISLGTKESCNGMTGTALLSPTNRDSITIWYSYYPNLSNSNHIVNMVFKGKRIP